MDPNLIEINEITDLFSYLKSIDWRGEWWLFGIGIFHIITALMAFAVSVNIQIVLFSVLLLLVYFSEFLNEMAAKYSYVYSNQQTYFDSNGMFISIIFCCPCLINCIFIITRWLMLSFELMTKVKTAQLKQAIKKKKELPAASRHFKSD